MYHSVKNSKMIEKILLFLQKADKIVTRQQGKTVSWYKNGFKDKTDIVTQTDILISNLFHRFIKKNFDYLNYSIIDEESTKEENVLETDYQFVIDPIDGTLPYSMNMPLYALSIAVFKRRKPLYGFIYMPATKELVYCDDKRVFFIEKAFQKQQKKHTIPKNQKTQSNLIFDTLFFVKMNDFILNANLICCSFFSSVVQFLYIVTARAQGSYFSGYLWDMAGAWPILYKLGFQIKNIENLSVITQIDKEHFDSNFHIKGVYIISKPDTFAVLKRIADVRKLPFF